MPIEAKPFSGIMDTDNPLEKVSPGHHVYARNGHFRGEEGNLRFENTLGNRDVVNPYLPLVATCPIISGLVAKVMGNRIDFYFLNSNVPVLNYRIQLLDSTTEDVIQTINTTNNFGSFNGVDNGTYKIGVIAQCAVEVDSAVVNSNDIIVNLSSCTPVMIGTYSLPNGTVGQSYNAMVPLNGTPPFTMTAITVDGITAQISGSNIVFSGTPTTAGTKNFSGSITNACGSANLNANVSVMSSGQSGVGYQRKLIVTYPGQQSSNKVTGGVAINGVNYGSFTVNQGDTHQSSYGTNNAVSGRTIVYTVSDSNVELTKVLLYLTDDNNGRVPVVTNVSGNNGTYTWANVDLSSSSDITIYLNFELS